MPYAQNKICLSFQNLARNSWENIRKSKLYNLSYRETTITETNLIDLSSYRISPLTIFDFSPYVESYQTGADWEWWFIDSNYSFGSAVQAKKIKVNDNYEIGFTPNNGVPQVDRLMDYCIRRGDLVPLYCFYNYWNSFPTIGNYNNLWGISLSYGPLIHYLFHKGTNFIDDKIVKNISRPWHELVCFPTDENPDSSLNSLPLLARHYVSNLLEIAESEFSFRMSIQFRMPKINIKPPERIQRAYYLQNSDSEEILDYIEEYFPENPPQKLIIYGLNNFMNKMDNM